MTKTTTISSNGQIVIPASLRRQLGLDPGDVLQVSAEGESLRVEKVPDWEELFGSVGRRARKPPSTEEIEAIRRARATERHEGS